MENEIDLSDPKLQKDLVTSYVKYYIANYPEDFKGIKATVAWKRDTNRTKFGEAGTDTDMRQTLEVPEILFKSIQARMPTWFSDNSNVDWFKKNFGYFDTTNVPG